MALFENNIVSFSSLEGLFAFSKTTKNSQIREKIANGALILIENLTSGQMSMSGSMKTAKPRVENIESLKKMAEAFTKDASPGVRNFGKEMRKCLGKVDEAIFSLKESTQNVSRETADDVSSASHHLASKKKTSLSMVLTNDSTSLKHKLDALTKTEPEEITQVAEFKSLLRSFENAKNLELKKELSKLLEKVDLAAVGPEIIATLAEVSAPLKLPLKFMVPKALAAFGPESFL